jgi:hypothetical protein
VPVESEIITQVMAFSVGLVSDIAALITRVVAHNHLILAAEKIAPANKPNGRYTNPCQPYSQQPKPRAYHPVIHFMQLNGLTAPNRITSIWKKARDRAMIITE